MKRPAAHDVQILEFLRHIIESIILQMGYPGIALVMFLERFFPPSPPNWCCRLPVRWPPPALLAACGDPGCHPGGAQRAVVF
jgi:hypothetical protein